MVRKSTFWIVFIELLVFSMLSISIMKTTKAQEIHDIAVVSVTPYPTKVGLGLGEVIDVTVIIENQGTENETFAVTVYYDSTTIETQNVVDQAPNTNNTLTFTWNTTDVTVGTYSINATASIVPNETDTADNTLISPSEVYVVSPYIAVLPRRTVDITLTAGKNYSISIITNHNGSDIWGYQFALTYNPLVLEGVEVVNGDLITEGNVTFVAGTFNNTIGKLGLTLATSLNKSAPLPYPPLNNTGPGVLANVTFTIVSEGDSSIELVAGAAGSTTELKRVDGTNIIDWITDVNPNPTKGKFLHGYFSNKLLIEPPVAVISAPSSAYVDESITFNGTDSYDPDGTIVSYTWDFGDETTIVLNEPLANHTYTEDGTYNVTLTVTDDYGLTDSAWKTLTVLPVHDVAVIPPIKVGIMGEDILSEGTVNATAGENITITVTVKNEGTVSENFTVTVYSNDTAIDTQTMTNLAAGDSETLEFVWDTTNASEGNYIIKAEASQVGGETDTADNTSTSDVTVTVRKLVQQFLPFPYVILIVLIIAIIVIGLVAYFYTKKAKRSESQNIVRASVCPQVPLL